MGFLDPNIRPKLMYCACTLRKFGEPPERSVYFVKFLEQLYQVFDGR